MNTTASNRERYANQGKRLETTIIASQGNVVILDKLPTSCKRIGKGRIIEISSPVDFIGEVIATGQSIQFDAKECGEKYRFPLDEKHLKSHQREWLIRHGQRGKAIAGLLIEATHPDVASYFWLNWRHLSTSDRSIEWIDRRMLHICGSIRSVDFSRIIEIERAQMLMGGDE